MNLKWENWHIKGLPIGHKDLILVSRIYIKSIDVAVHPINPSTVDAQTGIWTSPPNQSDLIDEFWASKRTCLKSDKQNFLV